MASLIKLYGIAQPVSNLGPGRRAVLWTSGCSLACKGCISPELQNPGFGKLVPVDSIPDRFNPQNNLTGITITGGEPFEQAQAVYELVKAIKKRFPDYNVLCFSGYHYSRLANGADSVQRLLTVIDLLVAGPFVQSRQQSDRLVASSNQKLIALTDEGVKMIEQVYKQHAYPTNVAIAKNGESLIVGTLDRQTRQRVHAALELTK